MKAKIIVILAALAFTVPAFADTDKAVMGTAGAVLFSFTNMAVTVPAVAAYAMLVNGENYFAGCPKELYESPDVTAKHPDSNYTFVTSACNYELNKDRLIRVN